MGIFSVAKKAVHHVVDLRFDRWADFQGIKNTTLYFWQHAKRLFSISRSEKSETFQEAVQRLDISDERLTEQAQQYYLLSICFGIFGVFLIVYGAFILILGNLIGGMISFALSLYSAALVFRFHFWRFQIRQRKLGCTLKEWSKSLYQ